MASMLCDELLADLSFAAPISRFTDADSSELPEPPQPHSDDSSSTKMEPLDCGRVPLVPLVIGLDRCAEEARDDVFSHDASVKFTSASASTTSLPSSSKTCDDASPGSIFVS